MRRKLVLSGVVFVVIGPAADGVDRVAPLGTYPDRERRHSSCVKTFPPGGPLFRHPCRKKLGRQSAGRFRPAAPQAGRTDAFPRSGPRHADPARLFRHAGTSSHSRRSERVCRRQGAGCLRQASGETACQPELWRAMESSIGSTSCASPKPTGSSTTRIAMTHGATATTSSARPTMTNPTIDSSPNNSPAMRLHPRKTKR
jgi:hypothetical protein